MLPEPLHPAVVHFPVVLAVLLPMFALRALWAIRRGSPPARAWALPVIVSAALAGSAWLAVETGEHEEDRVEGIVGAEILHEHEEAGERFLWLSGVLLLVSAGGLAGGRIGAAARYGATVGTLVLLLAGVQVGEAGGELVYRHGAASAYATPGGGSPAAPARPDDRRERERDDD